MNMQQLLFTVLTVLMLSAGQVLFKFAAVKMNPEGGNMAALLLNPSLLLALFVYGVATIFWLLVLRSVPLRIAYPFVALAFFIVPVLAHFLIGEPLRWQTFAGAAFIAVGVWISIQ